MGHANETWHMGIVDTDEPCAAVYIRDDTEDNHDDIELGGLILSDYARRAVACVNACKSIANPEALPELLRVTKDLVKFLKEDIKDARLRSIEIESMHYSIALAIDKLKGIVS